MNDLLFIPLTQGEVSIIDAIDYPTVSPYTWCMVYDGKNKYTNSRTYGKQVRMHSLIMGDPPNGMLIDHIDRNGLNNRRANLRFVTHQQNRVNSKPNRYASSSYKGVSWNIGVMRWVARIHIGGKGIYLGCFGDETEAAKAFDKAAKLQHGDHAYLNFK